MLTYADVCCKQRDIVFNYMFFTVIFLTMLLVLNNSALWLSGNLYIRLYITHIYIYDMYRYDIYIHTYITLTDIIYIYNVY
jgi:hypothetical protein